MENGKEELKNDIVTMVDVLNNANRENRETNFNSNCTYAEGYLKRQPLYACLTCNPESGDQTATQRAGICLACSIHCHDGHEVVQLGTKRNFRCDCGNKSKFPGLTCKLNPAKDQENNLNSYNQNFEHKFCTCHQPYLHPDNEVEDDMLQCIICEDWFHCCHLDEKPEDNTFDGEITCKECMEKHQFLYNYERFTIDEAQKCEATTSKETSNTESKEKCSMKTAPKEPKRCTKYWQDNWRLNLCKCSKCMKMYEEEKVLYLLDNEDTLDFLESTDRFKIPIDIEDAMDEDALELGMSILKSMDRIPMLNLIAEYEGMKDSLMKYLKKYADNRKVVREEDILEFFQTWTASKKRRTD